MKQDTVVNDGFRKIQKEVVTVSSIFLQGLKL
jgi:hypothetical protein